MGQLLVSSLLLCIALICMFSMAYDFSKEWRKVSWFPVIILCLTAMAMALLDSGAT